ncbi:hypothetical protein [uncultured Treponema sp.]|uniref:hypothetical protein n=1 Tax=uncultured Treponema sp. TaxID=162155 RepID=UPI000E87CA5B|nr:hypothetical protein [uncultured Treponema sp.]HAZ96369.1 hypothetical protein [Treponema sp.]
MIAVKAYYDGKSFVPLGNIAFKLKQSAIVVVDEENDSAEKSVSCRGLASRYANPSLINLEQETASAAFSGK